MSEECEACEECDGDKWVECPYCEGSGVFEDFDGTLHPGECGECGGTGTVTCLWCAE